MTRRKKAYCAILVLVSIIGMVFNFHRIKDFMKVFDDFHAFIPEENGCIVPLWNKIFTENVPHMTEFQKWASINLGALRNIIDAETRLLSAFVYIDQISIITTSQHIDNQNVTCLYYDCNRNEIRGSRFDTIVVPMTVVTCPRRPGVEFVSISLNATIPPHEPIPLIFRAFDKYVHELAVCVGPLYGNESKWLQIVEYVEHYKLLGTSFFYFTFFNLNEYDRKIIDYYAKLGYAEYTPYITEYQKLNWMFHLIQTQECHHRSRYHSKWVLNVDIDERVVYTGPDSFLYYLRSLPPTIGEISFIINRVMKTQKNPEKLSSLKDLDSELMFLKYNKTTEMSWFNVKGAIRPDLVFVLFYHWSYRQEAGVRVMSVPKRIAHIRHYRNVDIDALNGDWLDNYNGTFKETSLNPIFEKHLIEAVKEKVKYVYRQRWVRCEEIPEMFFTSEESNPYKRPIKAFILSAYYYPQSKSLGDNALALVMSINLGRKKENYNMFDPRKVMDETKIVAMARNNTSAIAVSTHFERITLHENCQMITVFATLQLLPNVEEIAMMSNDALTEIPYKIPSYIKRDVVVCISPIYVSEQWQNFLLAAHVYKQYGAHLHLYFISAVASFFQLMHEYEKHGYLTIQPWDRVTFPFVPGVIADVYQEMEFQSLAAAQTDCLLQYKESAKFIALFDINDILIPKLAPTLVEEFQMIMHRQKFVSYMVYPRQNFEATVFNNTRFSIQSLMNSLVDKNTQKPGRIIINPPNLNYTWMNRPLYVPDGLHAVDVVDNVITHLEKIVWENRENMKMSNEKTVVSSTFFNASKHTENMYKISYSEIESNLQKMLKKDAISEIVPTLPNFYYFYDLVNKCLEEKYYKFLRSKSTNWVKNICPGTQMCGFYQHPKIECVHVNAKHKFMEAAEPITYYYATEHHYTADIGCYAH